MPPGGGGGPSAVRSLSVRRPGGPAPINAAAAAGGAGPARISPQGRGDTRLTDFYDDYLDSYAAGGEDAPPVPPMPQPQRSPGDRVANWARNNANPPPPPQQQQQMMMRSRSVAPSSYAPSSVGGTMRRKMSRRAPTRSTYYEEEEGYVSGEYEDAPYEMTKIRVKVRSLFVL